MSENHFPNAKLDLMHKVNNKQRKEIKSIAGKLVGKGVLNKENYYQYTFIMQ
jgi:hypothetical protein